MRVGRGSAPFVFTSKCVRRPTNSSRDCRPGPAATTLLASPGWSCTFTRNGDLGTSRPANRIDTRYSPSDAGVYTHVYVCSRSSLNVVSACKSQPHERTCEH